MIFICELFFASKSFLISSIHSLFLTKEAAIKSKLLSKAKLISISSCSVIHGSCNLTQGRFICLLDPIKAPFSASTSI
jgi:hypothetical protein